MKWRNVGFVAACALGLLALGFGGGVLVVSSTVPPSLAGPAVSERTPVSELDFADPRAVDVEVTEAAPLTLPTKAAGTITAATCKTGGELLSGVSTFAVQGTGLINLATDEPLWRPLHVGDRGNDVAALQKELVRLGQDISVDGVFGTRTLKAAAVVIPAVRHADHVDPAQVLWLPATEAEILSCPVHRGEDVNAGDPLVEIDSGGTGVIVSKLAEDALPGPRELVVDDLIIPLSGEGEIDDAALRAELLETDAYRGTKGESAVTKLPGTARLSETVKVSSVPPSAILQGEGGEVCVTDGAKTIHVRIVGSELGQSFVMFEEGTALAEVLVAPTADSASCR